MENQLKDFNIEVALLKEKHKALRMTIMIICATLACLGIIGLICYLIAQNGFSVESLLSTILAIFSIVISMLFYFKTDTASSRFYDKVYEFNDTQHSLLASINSLFTEKFKNLDDRFDRMEITKKEIKGIEDEKGEIVDKFAKTYKIPDAEKTKLLAELSEKDRAVERLKNELKTINDSNIIKSINSSYYDAARENNFYMYSDLLKYFSKLELEKAVEQNRFDLRKLTLRQMNILMDLNLMNKKGDLYRSGSDIIAQLISSAN
jgi:uncharacterized membrane protein YciS (DUF1049 family)